MQNKKTLETNRSKAKKRFYVYEHNKGVGLTRHTRTLDEEAHVKIRWA